MKRNRLPSRMLNLLKLDGYLIGVLYFLYVWNVWWNTLVYNLEQVHFHIAYSQCLMGTSGVTSVLWSLTALTTVHKQGLPLWDVICRNFRFSLSLLENAGRAAHNTCIWWSLADLHLWLLFLQDSNGQRARSRSEPKHVQGRVLFLISHISMHLELHVWLCVFSWHRQPLAASLHVYARLKTMLFI